jgi:hypothetical protein
MDSPEHAAVKAHAAACAAHLPSATGSFAADLPGFAESVTRLEPRLTFHREGRPTALAAVRTALPTVERELLDAIVEDYACELAATQQAMYQIALALLPRTPPA